MFNKDETHPKMKRRVENANVVQYDKNYRFKERELICRTAVQCWTNFGGSEMRVIRGEGNDDKVRYWALQGGDNRDAAEEKTATRALAKRPSAKNQR